MTSPVRLWGDGGQCSLDERFARDARVPGRNHEAGKPPRWPGARCVGMAAGPRLHRRVVNQVDGPNLTPRVEGHRPVVRGATADGRRPARRRSRLCELGAPMARKPLCRRFSRRSSDGIEPESSGRGDREFLVVLIASRVTRASQRSGTRRNSRLRCASDSSCASARDCGSLENRYGPDRSIEGVRAA